MTDAVICEPLRTPVARYGGALRDVPVAELGATVGRALLQRTGLRPDHSGGSGLVLAGGAAAVFERVA